MNLRKLPPERRRKSVTLAAHGCCCCCCCCLHSVGGLIGSAVAGTKAHGEEARRTVKVYWLVLLGLTVLTVASLSNVDRRPHVGLGLILTAMVLPGVQLGASFFTLCASMFLALDKGTLGRITWMGFLWGLVGFLVMAVPLILLSYVS
jgi:streptolysin S family bacteriocin protoxin